MNIQSGNHAVAEKDRTFQAFTDGEGERHFEHVVKFEEPFEETLRILVALSHLDIASYTALRLTVTAEKISANGFTCATPRGQTPRSLGIGAQWMGFHAALSDFRLTGRIL
jgi:H-type lectin domain-containing protein